MYGPARFTLALAGLVPTALACLGWEGGLPTPTSSKTISAPITIGAGETFDAGWVKYDRGSGACEDGEGGSYHTSSPLTGSLL